MENQQVAFDDLLSDIAVIRRAVERARDDSHEARIKALGADLTVQTLALIVSGALALNEALSHHMSARLLLWSAESPSIAQWILAQTGFGLLLGVICIYVVLRLASRETGDSGQFLTRNFSHLRRFSFAADLLVKYLIVAFLVLGRQPGYIAPLFSLFIADWLLQGRFFALPSRMAIPLGGIAVLTSAVQFYSGSSLIAVPALLFATAASASVSRLVLLKKRLQRASSTGGAA